MKRLATWAFYAIGVIAIGYLALYAYVMLTGRDARPGAPIRIFKKPDAPSYSAAHKVIVSRIPDYAVVLLLPLPQGERGKGH